MLASVVFSIMMTSLEDDRSVARLLIMQSFILCMLLLSVPLKSYEPHDEKTCLYNMRTTKAQISLRIRAV